MHNHLREEVRTLCPGIVTVQVGVCNCASAPCNKSLSCKVEEPKTAWDSFGSADHECERGLPIGLPGCPSGQVAAWGGDPRQLDLPPVSARGWWSDVPVRAEVRSSPLRTIACQTYLAKSMVKPCAGNARRSIPFAK